MEFASIRIAALHSHPKQSEYFSDISKVELGELAEDMAYYGQRTPIRVLTDGTIVCGHQRVAAAKQLGWDEIEAYIIDADDELTEDEVTDELVAENIVGRQRDPLTLARCYRWLTSRYETQYPDEKGEMRDVLATKLNCGVSGRSLDRLARLLELPRDIQDMISRGELRKCHGEFLLKLATSKRENVIEQLRDSESPAMVMKCLRTSPATASTETSPAKALRNLLDGCKLLQACPSDFDTVQLPGRDVNIEIEAAIESLTTVRDRKRNLNVESLQCVDENLRTNCPGDVNGK